MRVAYARSSVCTREAGSPRRGCDALLRGYESNARGVQVQTFHLLVSSMLINVYLNILFLNEGSGLYSEAAAVSYRMTFSDV